MGYFEIDFLAVETAKSGDAIPMRYQIGDQTTVHVTDGGFQSTGSTVVAHLNDVYGTTHVDHVMVTHPDGDHAAGLRTVLEECTVGVLWMLRPWTYAAEIIDRFATDNSVAALEARLRKVYPNLAALEEMAIERGIPIYEPFQGAQVGAFTVMAPSRNRYLDLIVESERTPEAVEEESVSIFEVALKAAAAAVAFVRSAWGEEVFSPNPTSAENEMSVIQYACLEGSRILLTGDAGRDALNEAADFAPYIGLVLPGIERIQIPHHGSRRNVSTEVLDRWLGPRLGSNPGSGTFTAVVSSAKADTHHPRKAVIRAFMHRGANVFQTEGVSICSHGGSWPARNWGQATPVGYPDDQEEA